MNMRKRQVMMLDLITESNLRLSTAQNEWTDEQETRCFDEDTYKPTASEFEFSRRRREESDVFAE